MAEASLLGLILAAPGEVGDRGSSGRMLRRPCLQTELLPPASQVLLHLGRPFVFYWLFPYPDTMALWPQFRSPLVWDFFAVSTYFTVSLIFWYVGLIPDVATLRDQAKTRVTP